MAKDCVVPQGMGFLGVARVLISRLASRFATVPSVGEVRRDGGLLA